MKPKADWLTEEQLKEMVAEEEKKIGHKICGYPIAEKDGVKICKKPAGAETNHLGVGRCKAHGGVSGFKSGINSIYTSEEKKFSLLNVIKRYEQQTDWDTLRTELATARGILEATISDSNKTGKIFPTQVAMMLKTIDTIGSTVEKQTKLEERNLYTLGEIQMILKQIIEIIESDVESVSIKKRLFEHFKGIILQKQKSKKEKSNDD